MYYIKIIIGVFAELAAEKLHHARSNGHKLRPRFGGDAIFYIKEVHQGTIGYLHGFMYIVGVGCPHEVMHIIGYKMPGLQGRCFAGAPFAGHFGFIYSQQFAGGGHYIGGIEGNVHIKAPPGTVKFTGYIGLGVPAVAVVGTDLGVPLAHGVGDTLFVVATTTPDLQRHLTFKGHVEHSTAMWQDRMMQGNF